MTHNRVNEESIKFPKLTSFESNHHASELHPVDIRSNKNISETNSKSISIIAPQQDAFLKLQKENKEAPVQDSAAFILAQIERQNALLERDPKSIVIQSNKLKAHFSIMQKLVKDNSNDDNEEVDWGFWEAVIQDSDQIALKLPHLLALKLRSGIPTRVRGLIWQAMSKSSSMHLETVYQQLCEEKSPHERIIQRDLARTFPRIEMFKQENGQGQLSMKRILEAYSLYDTDVGYCQGLAFLVGPLLLNMPETQSFCVFVRLMETYEMRTMFTLNMDGLHLHLYQFSSLLKEILPDLTRHLNDYGIHPAMFASQWFLTLFAYVFPMELVNRIYDVVFAEGAAETIMRVAIAMLRQSESIILYETSTEFEDILDFLTSRKLCEPYINGYNHVIQDAMSLSDIITKSRLEELSKEYDSIKSTDSSNLSTSTGKFSFWRRKNSDVSNMKRSASSVSTKPTSFKCQNVTSRPPVLAKRWSSISAPKDCLYGSDASTFEEKTKNVIDSDSQTIKQLKKELKELKHAHQQTLQELQDTRYEKQCLQSENLVLKLTVKDLSGSRVNALNSMDAIDEIADNSLPVGSLETSICMSSSSTTMLTLTSDKSYSTTDDDDTHPATPKSVVHDYCDSDFSDKFVQLKVENFELEQKCEGLICELEQVQSKLDMVNEGQMALFDKILAMKSETEELILEKQDKEQQNHDLKLRNETLQLDIMKMKTVFATSFTPSSNFPPNNRDRRHSLPYIGKSNSNIQVDPLQWSANTPTNAKPQCASGRRKSSIYGRVLNAFGKSSYNSVCPNNNS